MPNIVQTFLEFTPLAKAGVFFWVGACVGSFLNVLIYRIPRGHEWVRTRSACPSCGHILGAGDLIPIMSWVALRGRCRYCKTRVSAQYPLVEAATGAAFAAVAYMLCR